MKTLRREMANMILFALLPTLLAFAFPLEALKFQAAKVAHEPSVYVALVELSAADEDKALQQARTSWQIEKGTKNDWRVRLRLEDLPETEEPVSKFVLTPPVSAKEYINYDFPAYLPSHKSVPPPTLRRADTEILPLTFSREELLKLNEREIKL